MAITWVMWKSAETPPEMAGRYLVGNRTSKEVNVARYAPKKKEWKFASAQQAFSVDAWADLPAI